MTTDKHFTFKFVIFGLALSGHKSHFTRKAGIGHFMSLVEEKKMSKLRNVFSGDSLNKYSDH